MKKDWLELVRGAIQADVPVMVWGPPGIGKTERIRALAHELGMGLYTILLREWDPAEFTGFPVVTPDGRVVRQAPEWVIRLAQEPVGGIVFLDELTTARPANQASALCLVAGRRVNESTSLPPTARIVAAGNPPDMVAGGHDLSAPMASRFIHVEATPDLAQWSNWAISKGGFLQDVAAFLQRRPDLIYAPPAPDAVGLPAYAWPNPRQWELAARLVDAGGADVVAALSAAVGPAAALEFIEWRRTLELPSPEATLSRPAEVLAGLPNDRLDIVVAAVLAAVSRAAVDGAVDAAWGVVAATLDAGFRTAAVMGARAVRSKFNRAPVPRPLLVKLAELLREAGLA